ncbi:Proline iminopeptidase [Mycena indigotica]|uniref:Proline iminopeptidase n=1 Tax=Mycena indigotica TaxID=2126181 RepID=A0A8H6SE30_9AGAR|nr:Proline iminopeptidase [Mycena indigotica]KAF7297041.1 Proline iminopeptidase [Mycena indigotica]
MGTSEIITTEGEAPFSLPAAGKDCVTWYKIVGSLTSGIRPLVTLHGGPGVPHNYLLSMIDLATKYGIPVIFYDQLGNGKSTHLPEKRDDTTFWTEQLFLDELDNLLKFLGIDNDYALLGQSWGGMLGSRHASRQPPGLKKLIIESSPASMPLWEEAAAYLRTLLPPEVAQVLTDHEIAGTTESAEYQRAMAIFYERFLCRIPFPTELEEAMQWIEKDPTVYFTMNGPSEFFVTGSLKTWSMLEDAIKITVPTLLINGAYDEARDSTVYPYFEKISGPVRWVTLAESSHMCHWEEREKFMELVAGFLNRNA